MFFKIKYWEHVTVVDIANHSNQRVSLKRHQMVIFGIAGSISAG